MIQPFICTCTHCYIEFTGMCRGGLLFARQMQLAILARRQQSSSGIDGWSAGRLHVLGIIHRASHACHFPYNSVLGAFTLIFLMPEHTSPVSDSRRNPFGGRFRPCRRAPPRGNCDHSTYCLLKYWLTPSTTIKWLRSGTPSVELPIAMNGDEYLFFSNAGLLFGLRLILRRILCRRILHLILCLILCLFLGLSRQLLLNLLQVQRNLHLNCT